MISKLQSRNRCSHCASAVYILTINPSQHRSFTSLYEISQHLLLYSTMYTNILLKRIPISTRKSLYNTNTPTHQHFHTSLFRPLEKFGQGSLTANTKEQDTYQTSNIDSMSSTPMRKDSLVEPTCTAQTNVLTTLGSVTLSDHVRLEVSPSPIFILLLFLLIRWQHYCIRLLHLVLVLV